MQRLAGHRHRNPDSIMYCQLTRVAQHVVCSACGWAWETDIDPSTIRKQCGNPGRVTLPTACVLRGQQTRQVQCLPCQAGSSAVVLVPAFQCLRHTECTLRNTGGLPKIQNCSTCENRIAPLNP